jgi:hypothetical protein
LWFDLLRHRAIGMRCSPLRARSCAGFISALDMEKIALALTLQAALTAKSNKNE